jgi:hypothetical protein
MKKRIPSKEGSQTIELAMEFLIIRGLLKKRDTVVIISSITSSGNIVDAVQMREIA